jgi:hypothetical protein
VAASPSCAGAVSTCCCARTRWMRESV